MTTEQTLRLMNNAPLLLAAVKLALPLLETEMRALTPIPGLSDYVSENTLRQQAVYAEAIAAAQKALRAVEPFPVEPPAERSNLRIMQAVRMGDCL